MLGGKGIFHSEKKKDVCKIVKLLVKLKIVTS